MIKIAESSPNVPALFGLTATTTTINPGDLLYVASGLLTPATSSAGTTLTLVGISTQKAVTTGTSTTIKFIPLYSRPYVIADCTNTNNVNQLLLDHAMTDAAHVNNTSSTVATYLGVFKALALVGTTQLFGYFNVIGQITTSS